MLHSEYVGLDGTSPFADRVVDLRAHRSSADCIFMRHVLEHNVEWRKILHGAVNSFRKRMVLNPVHAIYGSHQNRGDSDACDIGSSDPTSRFGVTTCSSSLLASAGSRRR